MMKLMEISIYLIIFSFVITAFSILSITGPAYVDEEGAGNYDEIGATSLIWAHIAKNILVSLFAGIIAAIIAAKLMNIPGSAILNIGIFTGLLSHGVIGTAGLLWNIYYSLNPTIRPSMGLALYLFFSLVGILVALSIMHILSEGGLAASDK